MITEVSLSVLHAGPRLVDCFEFLVGLLHQQHDRIPADFPWRFYKHGELAEAEEKWLQEHPGWKTRVQEGPPKTAAAANGCCVTGSCGAAAAPAGEVQE
jgi:hypothetical protein